MRVISGMLRGLKLDSPSGLETRPTLDRIKESLFNIIFSHIFDADVLDLFAGSGALGIEALSRGAESCTFADNNEDAVRVVRSNLKKAHLEDKSKIFWCDSIEFLKKTDKKYDVIFLDPPYQAGLYEKALFIIKQRRILNSEGIVAVECDASVCVDTQGYTTIKDRTYGKVRIYILEDAAGNEKDSSISGKL